MAERSMHPITFQLRAHRRDVVVLVAAALVVRVIWLWFGSWMANDSTDYLTIAGNLIDHHSFSLSADGALPTAFRPPLFPGLIALIWSLAGKSITAVLIVNVVLGAATVGLTYLTARQRFGRSTSLLAGGALAIAPMTSLFTVTVLTEALFTFLVVLAILLWGWGRFRLAGVAFGLAALARPTLLPFLLILALLPLLPRWRPVWRQHLTMAAIAMCVVGVWTIRNAVVFDRFISVASAGVGVNLLCGTLETDTSGNVWYGVGWAPLDLHTHPVTRVEGAQDEFAVDKIRRDRAIARIMGDPVQWVIARSRQYPKLFIDNGDYLLGSANLPIRKAASQGVWGVVIFKLGFIAANLAVLVLAAFGLSRMRDDLIETSNIWLFPVFGALIHLPMWIEPRYFLPMMPMVFILAAYAVTYLRKPRPVTAK